MIRGAGNEKDGQIVRVSGEESGRAVHQVTGHPVTVRHGHSGELWWYVLVSGTLALLLVGLLTVIAVTPTIVDSALFPHHPPSSHFPGGGHANQSPFDPARHWGVWSSGSVRNKGVVLWG